MKYEFRRRKDLVRTTRVEVVMEVINKRSWPILRNYSGTRVEDKGNYINCVVMLFRVSDVVCHVLVVSM